MTRNSLDILVTNIKIYTKLTRGMNALIQPTLLKRFKTMIGDVNYCLSHTLFHVTPQ